MNATHIQEEDLEFLLQSIRICGTIDPYVDVLGLNAKEVEVFKKDIRAVLYVVERYKSFAASFILYNIRILRNRVAALILECSRSANYTRKIGEELGIEVQLKFNIVPPPELMFFHSGQN